MMPAQPSDEDRHFVASQETGQAEPAEQREDLGPELVERRRLRPRRHAGTFGPAGCEALDFG